MWADAGNLEERVSMVSSDIELPQMDGYTLVRELRQDRRFAHLYVMMHSSLYGSFNSRACHEAGADRLLAKFDPDEFATAVAEYLAGCGPGVTDLTQLPCRGPGWLPYGNMLPPRWR
jgi:two-component system chemotaxis response regulator CheV